MKFDDPEAGNSLKVRRRHGELKECVLVTTRFHLKKGKSTVIAEKKKKIPVNTWSCNYGP